MGVLCECPIHTDCWIHVPFRNCIDGGPPHQPERALWNRIGEDFETLTLSPSIRILGGEGGCEWHGFIKNGCFETCEDAR